MASAANNGTDGEPDVPILKEEDIILSVKDFINVQLTVNDLRQPNPERLKSIYGPYLCTFLQISNEQVTQIPLHVMETIAHTDLHLEEGAGVILFVKAVAEFLERCGITDFTANDIFFPTKKRTRKIFSAMVNFVRFDESFCKESYRDMVTYFEKCKKKQEEFLQIKQELPNKIKTLKAQRLERQRDVQELNLIGLKAKSENLEAIKKEVLMRNSEIAAEVEEQRNLLMISHAKKSVDDANEAIKELKDRYSSMLVKENLVIKQIEEVAPSALRLVHAIQPDVEKSNILFNDLEKTRDYVSEISKDIRAISAKKQNMENLVSGKKEMLARCCDRREELENFLKETQEKLAKKKLLLDEDLKHKMQQKANILEDINQIDQLTLLYEEEHRVSMKAINDKFDSLSTKLLQYENLVKSVFQSNEATEVLIKDI